MACLVLAGPAGAAVTASQVTSPPEGLVLDVEIGDAGQLTVTGTATADDPDIDKVDLVCTEFEQPDGSADSAITLTGGQNLPLTPTGGFTANVDLAGLDYNTCRVRAVPDGTDAGNTDLSAFAGRVIYVSGHSVEPGAGGLVDYYQNVSGLLGYWDGSSTGACFVNSTFTFDPLTLGWAQLFECVGVFGEDPTTTRSALRIDGQDAYLPATADGLGASGVVPISGYARSFDPATTNASQSGGEVAVRCADGAYPPNPPTTCPTFTGAGLTDVATTVGDHGGRLVRHRDLWTNPGAAARQLDVWYQVDTAGGKYWQFPGDAAPAQHAGGDHTGEGGNIPTPPAGPGSALVVKDPALSGTLNPRGALTWSAPPSEIVFTAPGRAWLHYQRTVPAGGTATISLAFATDRTQAGVDALVADALAGLLPTVAITSPAEGSAFDAATVAVSGTSSDDGPTKVSVNGVTAAVAGDGTWSADVPLTVGSNTLTATVTDDDGNTASAQRNVVRNQPSNVPSPSNLFQLRLKKPKRGAKAIVVRLDLPGPGVVAASLTASVKGAARTVKLAKPVRRTVTKAGTVRLKLKLTKKARKLIRKRRKLKSKLTVRYTPTGGSTRRKAAKRTLRAAKRKR